MKTKNVLFLFLSAMTFLESSIPRTNLFWPYDIFLIPYRRSWCRTSLSFVYEGAFHSDAFQDDDFSDFQVEPAWRIKANPMQLFQCTQDGLAALKGDDFDLPQGELGQSFNIDDDNGTHGHFKPCGKLRVQQLMAMNWWFLREDTAVGFFIPFIDAKLKHVRWVPINQQITFEDLSDENLLPQIEALTGLRLFDWHRWGFGDFTGMVHWWRYYPQMKPFLKNVYLSVRGALVFPTGKKENPDLPLGFAFGNDGALGVLGAGTIELWFTQYTRLGIDGEFYQQFGSTRVRRIKTDPAQTDLLFPVKVKTFKDFGFRQHYTLWLEFADCIPSSSFKVTYQYTKHNDDRISLCSNHFDTKIANTAESLQEWSTHTFIFSFHYDHCRYQYGSCAPSVMLFAKTGFNGKRAILFDSVGAQVTFNY